MFALCTAVTRLRPLARAVLKAYSAMRKDLVLVMIFRHSTTPGTFCRDRRRQSVDVGFVVIINYILWTHTHTLTLTHTSCSRLLYSPSVFSLMIMMSTFLWRVLTPGRDWQCITLAYRSREVLQREESRKNDGDRRMKLRTLFKSLLHIRATCETVVPV